MTDKKVFNFESISMDQLQQSMDDSKLRMRALSSMQYDQFKQIFPDHTPQIKPRKSPDISNMPKLELPKGVIDSHDVTLFDITEKSDTDMMDIENNSFIQNQQMTSDLQITKNQPTVLSYGRPRSQSSNINDMGIFKFINSKIKK